MTDLLARAAACGIEAGYHDYTGRWQPAPEATLERILEALEPDREALPALDRSWSPPGALRCHLPKDLRGWGWAVQLYGVRSNRSWGIGDLGDLSAFVARATEQGASFVMYSPLGAPAPGNPMQTSPYFPGSRTYRNPVYLAIDHVAGYGPELDHLRVRGRRLNNSALVDRDAVWAIKASALEHLFGRFAGHNSFDRYCAEGGAPLEHFATFCALGESHGPDWSSWPPDLHRPGGRAVAEFRDNHRRQVEFHKYLQWLLDVQLAGAASNGGLINDLPVGIDPAGADAWVFRGAFAEGFSVGAPPDEFNRGGQDWGAAPLHPARLAALDYEPFRRTIRAALRHACGLRIDHVMGLFRLFWIPHGCDPTEGTYVRYPAAALLDVLAEESRSAEAFVVGEDLGTVEPGVREALHARNVLSYRLLIFEPDLEQVPEEALAAVTTHDLPTVPGIWSGSDAADQERAAVVPAPDALADMRSRLAAATGCREGDPVEEVVERVYCALSSGRARLVAVAPEDLAGQTRRPNMPGTTDTWPNWCIPLPLTLEDFFASTRVLRLARCLTDRARTPRAPASEPSD